MKEKRKKYITPTSQIVVISSLLNWDPNTESGFLGVSGGKVSADMADARENSFFESNVFEEEEN